ncbi:SMEK domain-containing protein [Bacillus cereus group sp. BfR-BA-01524]|uniref:SMEK domain-containing protein n=1 Tax=Bacillus cereus group sp. BfR-BA-01524 TaxID=2920372 RepID=UPI001F58B070
MLKRKDEIEDIIKSLSLLQYYVKFSSNKLGLHDINKTCEAFFCELFNILWGNNYKRLEFEKKNYPGIDLGDKTRKHSMQITSDGLKEKLWNTIEKFEKNELYKEYNLLIHFIIGEKHYLPRVGDKILFEKSVTDNTYSVVRKVKNAEYKIIIMDLMDLLLLFDEKENKVVSKIHEYIKENINSSIEVLGNKGYKIDPDELKVFTANSFLKFCEPESLDERNEFFSEIQKLANQINEMSEPSKGFLYKILDNHQKNSKNNFDSVQIDPFVIQKSLDLSDRDMESEIAVLRNAKLFNETAYEDEQMLGIEYYGYNGHFDYIVMILQYCKEEGIDIRKLILTPDFSLLD